MKAVSEVEIKTDFGRGKMLLTKSEQTIEGKTSKTTRNQAGQVGKLSIYRKDTGSYFYSE